MTSLLAFSGRIGRWPYLGASLALVLIQHMLAYLVLTARKESLATVIIPWAAAWRATFETLLSKLPESGFALAMAALVGLVLLSDWALAALAFRCARATNESFLLAALAVIPFVQLFGIVWLTVRADAPATTPEPASTPARVDWHSSVVGMLAGAGIGVVAVMVFAVLLGTYGLGLFVATPVLMGMAASYVANCHGDVGVRRSIRIALDAVMLGSLGLIGFALEGFVCLLMAAPIIVVMAIVGALVGRTLASARRYRQSTMMSLVALPFLFAIDAVAPPHAEFETSESIEIAASAPAVWDSVVHMGPIHSAPSAPFGWGLAYPMRGTIRGSGVGAVREGVFSTGTAYERVTVWEPNRRLSFIVLSDPPMMTELSPFGPIATRHVSGYFRTIDARFAIEPLASGTTRLTLATRHSLDIGPTDYWLPFARAAIHANKLRVLAHFRDQAEHRGGELAEARGSGASSPR